MIEDAMLAKNQCCTVFIKPSPDVVGKDFFKMATDTDLTSEFYFTKYRVPVKDKAMKRIIRHYHPDSMYIDFSGSDDNSSVASSIQSKYILL